jgi:lyso-ornithine lipid O-acyltransferase
MRTPGRRLLKALLLVAHIVYGLGLSLWLALGGTRYVVREALAQSWHRRLLKILGLRLRVEGAPLRGAHITASNHVSWLDIPVLGALEPTRFISKSEVRDWPVAGTFAVACGTFFIRRGKGGAAPLLEKLVPHLKASGSVVLFPEGTTTDGTLVRPFHSRLFAAAIEARRPVQPVTLQYNLSPDGERIAPFIGDDSLVNHVLRLLQVRELEVQVRYGPPIQPIGTRDALALEAEEQVRGSLQPATLPSSVAAPDARPRWSEA